MRNSKGATSAVPSAVIAARLPPQSGACAVFGKTGKATLYTLVYGPVIAASVDPIEKKPIYHLYPGSESYSIAAVGCNFRCTFCQNHEISQMPREEGRITGREMTPREVVNEAINSTSKSISYTYTEPTIFFEFAHDTARLAREQGLKNIFVTNGFMTQEALEAASPWLDAANVDLKSFRDEFYRRHCGAHLEPVLETLRGMKKRGIWVEVTTLVIPTLNDDEGELREIAAFIRSLGDEVPWHVSRFFPRYKCRAFPRRRLRPSTGPWRSAVRPASSMSTAETSREAKATTPIVPDVKICSSAGRDMLSGITIWQGRNAITAAPSWQVF